MKKISLFVLALFLITTLPAQHDSCWNVLLLSKGHTLKQKPDMAAQSNSGFYLYRNCIYEIGVQNRPRMQGRLIEVRKDTLLFSTFVDSTVALKAQGRMDTLKLLYTELEKLYLISDRAMGLYNSISFSNYNFLFRKDTACLRLESLHEKIYQNSDVFYELIPQLTGQGIGLVFIENGAVYYYYGPGMSKPDPSKADTLYQKRNYCWFTPCMVEEINGLAIGLFTKNIKNYDYNKRDSLLIRGLNLQLNFMAMVMLLQPHCNGPYPDSLPAYTNKFQYDWQTDIRGMNISLVSTIGETRIHGASISGAITVVDEIHGVSISGLSNFSYIMRGSLSRVYTTGLPAPKGCRLGCIIRRII